MSTLRTNPVVTGTLLARTDDEALFEIVDGQEVELPPMSTYAAAIATTLIGEMDVFAMSNPIAHPWAETLFTVAPERFPQSAARRGLCYLPALAQG
jgi:hypothetical protein